MRASTLRECDRQAGKTYPLGYDTATMHDVAEILTDAVGKPFRLEAHSSEEFLAAMLKSRADSAYMHCIYNQLKLNAANNIPCADATFDNFEEITGLKLMTWQDFAQKHKAEFDY